MHERVLVRQSQRDRRDNDLPALGDELHGGKCNIGPWIGPTPQVKMLWPACHNFGLPIAKPRPRAAPARVQTVGLVGHGQEWQLPEADQVRNFEAFADRHSFLLAIDKLERILRYGLANRLALLQL